MNKKEISTSDINENKTDSPDDMPLSLEEHELYSRIIKLSYPQPKKSIKDGVMAHLNGTVSESSESSALISALISADTTVKSGVKNRSAKKHRSFVKYGSIAACFAVLLAGIAGIIPMLNSLNTDKSSSGIEEKGDENYSAYLNTVPTYDSCAVSDIVKDEVYEPDEFAAPRQKASYYANNGEKSGISKNNDEAECEFELYSAEENCGDSGIYDDYGRLIPENAEEYSLDAELSPKSSQQTEYYEENLLEHTESISAGGSDIEGYDASDSKLMAISDITENICAAHSTAYHEFAPCLINYVGEESFHIWYESEQSPDWCGKPSVKTFVYSFNIDRELFTALIADENTDYDISEIYPEQMPELELR